MLLSAFWPIHLFFQQLVQLLLAVVEPPAIGRVHHPDESVRRLEVVAPVGAEGLLAAHVPDVEAETEREEEADSNR